MKLGDTFETYEDFLESLDNYSKQEFVSFWKRDARTISAARNKTGRVLDPKLKYYQLKYTCINGGREFKSTGKGKKVTSTYKSGCNAHISLRASLCGTKLLIISMETEHNHIISKELYGHLPQQRRLPTDIQTEILHLAKLKTKRRKIKSYIEEKCNKILLLKDIHNIANKSENIDESETLQESIENLQNKYGADCHILSDEDNHIKALFFQSEVMKHYMSSYPEFICIDATYKLLDITTPIILMINEDGNGLSEIVSVGLLVEENAETLQWFFSTFKENNSNWGKVKSILANKDSNEGLLKEQFPNAHISICIFHAMRSFNREISTVKLNITPAQRHTALEIIQKMVYSKIAEAYNTLYEDLLKNCPVSVVEYFNRNWHGIRDEWNLGAEYQQSNFLNTTNNKIESITTKIKTLVYSTLSNFIDDFFKVILIMNDERDHKAANSIQKLSVNFYEKDSILYKYHQLLTSYAFEFVEQQYTARNDTPKHNYGTTLESCNCGSRTTMMLPCRHILKKREELGIDYMFEENLCNKRWTRAHYHSNQRIFLTDVTNIPDNSLPSTTGRHTVTEPGIKLNQQQKFSKAWMILKSLAGLVSGADDARYHLRLRQLIQLKTAWENDEDLVMINAKSEDAYENIPGMEEHFENEIFYIKQEDETRNFEAIAQDYDEKHVPEGVQNDGREEATQDHDPNIDIKCEFKIVDVVSMEDNDPLVSSTRTTALMEDNDPLESLMRATDSMEDNDPLVSLTTSTDLIEDNDPYIGNIKLPIALKKRGRPKGRGNTTKRKAEES